MTGALHVCCKPHRQSDFGAPALPRREHPWQESAAGRDRARPVDATLEPGQPPYWAHGMVARARQASR